MPTRQELIATGRDDNDIRQEIGADYLIYQDLDSLNKDVRQMMPSIKNFETSCFDGNYVTGDVTPEYLAMIESKRNTGAVLSGTENSTQLDLSLVAAD